MPRALALLNVLLPGSGLVVAGRLALGLPLLAPLPLLAALWIASGLVASPAVAGPLRAWLLGLWLALALLAGLLQAWAARGARLDPAAVRAAHRAACAAWLQGRHAEALPLARRLAALAPREPGAWGFLALVAESAGEPRVAARARVRAARLALG